MKKTSLRILSIFCVLSTQICMARNTDHIKPDCTERVKSHAVEEFMDYIIKHGYGAWVATPNRGVPVILVSRDEGTISYLRCEIPHRIDMLMQYSHDINEAVETRDELPFAAFRELRKTAESEEAINVEVKDAYGTWTLYNAREVDAGKYGTILCFDPQEGDKINVTCMTHHKELQKYLALYRAQKLKRATDKTKTV